MRPSTVQTHYYYFPASSDNCTDGYKPYFIVTFFLLNLGEGLLAIRLQVRNHFIIVFVSSIFASDDEKQRKIVFRGNLLLGWSSAQGIHSICVLLCFTFEAWDWWCTCVDFVQWKILLCGLSPWLFFRENSQLFSMCKYHKGPILSSLSLDCKTVSIISYGFHSHVTSWTPTLRK